LSATCRGLLIAPGDPNASGLVYRVNARTRAVASLHAQSSLQ